VRQEPKPELFNWFMRAIVAAASLSIGINSFLLKDKLDQIAADMRSMSLSVQSLQVDRAVMMNKAEQNADELAKHQEMLMVLDRSMSILKEHLKIR
jgi:outer membrane murein-binding lipoprotein Lpp